MPDTLAMVMVAFAVASFSGMTVYHLLWRRAPTPFWIAIALIAVGVALLVVTGAYQDVARFLWPIAFDEVRGPEMRRKVECAGPTLWATGLIMVPVMLVLFVWLKREARWWVKALIGVGFYALFFLVAKSPLPETVTRLVEPNIEQKLPAHCPQRVT